MMTLSNPDIKTFKLGYTTLYIGGLVTMVITLLFVFLGNYFQINPQVRDAIALFTAGLVSTTLIYTAKNLRLNFEATQAKLLFDSEKFEYDKQVKQDDLQRKFRIIHFRFPPYGIRRRWQYMLNYPGLFFVNMLII